MEWLARHAHHLPRIYPDSYPVEEACEDIEYPLQSLQLGQSDDYIFGIKLCRQVTYQHAKHLCALLCFHHHRRPVSDYGVHKQVEELGGEGVSLGHSTVPLEGEVVVSAGSVHHVKPNPVCLEDLERPGADPICHDNLEASVPIQGVIRILEVQEYLKEDHLTHVSKLLQKIGLDGGGLCPMAFPKPVHHIMEWNYCREPLVKKAGDILPKDLY